MMWSSMALWLASVFLFPLFALAQTPGTFKIMGDTKVSAMMLFLGNTKKVYILDKVENNPTTINGHPAWAVEWEIETGNTRIMDMSTNTFCAAGMHLPNGSFTIFGGNGAIGPGGSLGSVNDQFTGQFDATYQDWDGGRSIRILDPCTDDTCGYLDNSTDFVMKKRRWYPGCEALADGTVVLVGGFTNGGYINRNYPNTDPFTSGGAAEPSYEFWPPRPQDPAEPTVMQFMGKTSGLNAYALMFLLPDGQMFVQANLSTIIWDYNTNTETPLPDMPNGVVRVYPASGGSAMLPLTPENNYTPTLLFCGGINLTDDQWGDYGNPVVNTWEFPASNDCQRITPQPTDGSAPAYVPDDFMLEGRTMGQFIHLPDMTMLMVNGGGTGTAGYAQKTGQTPLYGDMPFGMSLAAKPVLRPALYDPRKPPGQRWSNDKFDASTIPRLYHSSALLLPDASVMIAGSNPNVDVNTSTVFSTEYRAEYFYPSYFSATNRPAPTGIPPTLSYGGPTFDIVVPSSSYSGLANDAAQNTDILIIRPGWTTHGINMGQRLLKLNNTFTVSDDGTITYHVAQLPPNPNLFQPGPVLFFVTINGIPSIGEMVTVGSGSIGQQPTFDFALPPPPVFSSKNATGSASPESTDSSGTAKPASNGPSTGVIIAAAVAGVAVLVIAGVFIGVCIVRRRRRAGMDGSQSLGRGYHDKILSTDSSANMMHAATPLNQYSSADLIAAPYGQRYADQSPNLSTTDFNPYMAHHQQASYGSQSSHGYPRYV
jgi:hypothetical protein